MMADSICRTAQNSNLVNSITMYYEALFNPFLTSGHVHSYHLEESKLVLEIPVSKQC